jgi:histidine ammonia-lyase
MILQYVRPRWYRKTRRWRIQPVLTPFPPQPIRKIHVSMGTIASRHAYQIIQNVRQVLAIELICGCRRWTFAESKKCAYHQSHL